MKVTALLLLVFFGLLFVHGIARAQVAVEPEYAWNDLQHRLSLGARAEYDWFARGSDTAPTLDFKHEWGFGVAGSYYLVPKWSLIGGTTYGVDNKLFRSWAGLNIKLYGEGR